MSGPSSSRKSIQNLPKAHKLVYKSRAHRIMALLEESNVMQSASSADVYLAPPEPHVLTDEDSGDEDFGGTFNNLNSDQLQSEAEAVIHQQESDIRIDERNINFVEDNVDIVFENTVTEEENIGNIDNDTGGICSLNGQGVPEKSSAKKSAKTIRSWIQSDLPCDNQLTTQLRQNKSEWKNFLPSFYSRPLTPLQIFNFFFNEELLTHIVKETVRYAIQKGTRLEFGIGELKPFIGILLVSGYNVNSRRRMYWEESDDVKNIVISNSMRRNRFETIIRFLHFNDNLTLDQTDRTYKILPYLQMLRKTFFEHTIWESESSIDEAMIPYYGRHGMKQHIKGKPIRFGYKNWSWNLKGRPRNVRTLVIDKAILYEVEEHSETSTRKIARNLNICHQIV